MIKNTIVQAVLAEIESDANAAGVWVGTHWTLVLLEDGRCGMASTLREHANHHRGEGYAVGEPGRLHTRSAEALAAYTDGRPGPEASVGWAAVNALTSRALEAGAYQTVELDAVEHLLEHGAGKRVALVGHFPFTPRLRAGVGTLWVLELNPGEGDLPASAAPEVLPKADVIAITSLTLVNNTFNGLAEHINPAAHVMMLGPSTPLSSALFARGVDVLSGVRIADPEAAMHSIAQGAAFPQVQGVQKVTVTKRE